MAVGTLARCAAARQCRARAGDCVDVVDAVDAGISAYGDSVGVVASGISTTDSRATDAASTTSRCANTARRQHARSAIHSMRMTSSSAGAAVRAWVSWGKVTEGMDMRDSYANVRGMPLSGRDSGDIVDVAQVL